MHRSNLKEHEWYNFHDVAILDATSNVATPKNRICWSTVLYYWQLSEESLTTHQLVLKHILNCVGSYAAQLKSSRYTDKLKHTLVSYNETAARTMTELMKSSATFVMHFVTAWKRHGSNISQDKHEVQFKGLSPT